MELITIQQKIETKGVNDNMSMNESPCVDAGFFIDDYACAILMRAWHKEEDIWDDEESAELARLCDDPDFFKKAATGELPKEFYSVYDVEEFGKTFNGGTFVYCNCFCGTVATLPEAEAGEYAIDKSFDEDNICYVGLTKEKKWFSAAYESVDDMVQEIKDYFGDIVVKYFPLDFDWAVRICNINGTDYS